jgi:hypothetical protein
LFGHELASISWASQELRTLIRVYLETAAALQIGGRTMGECEPKVSWASVAQNQSMKLVLAHARNLRFFGCADPYACSDNSAVLPVILTRDRISQVILHNSHSLTDVQINGNCVSPAALAHMSQCLALKSLVIIHSDRPDDTAVCAIVKACRKLETIHWDYRVSRVAIDFLLRAGVVLNLNPLASSVLVLTFGV